MNIFFNDVKHGLLSKSKNLYSKYFYDILGDSIFQELMHSPEYYLSKCELEILQNQSYVIANTIKDHFKEFDLIELGAGDASKSSFLLQALQKTDAEFTYYPIDISSNAIASLEKELPKTLPSLKITGLNGEYLDMLKQQTERSKKSKVVLFLGSNIGNMTSPDAIIFCEQVRKLLNPGDLLFIGFDLKKNPSTILAAYNDKEGLTRKFNLNLLKRINKELEGNFNLNNFYHYPCYDPGTGDCKSYLISGKDQEVKFGQGKDKLTVQFRENESIFMEISKKYDLTEIESIAVSSGFSVTNHFFDSKKWFVDSLWKRE